MPSLKVICKKSLSLGLENNFEVLLEYGDELNKMARHSLKANTVHGSNCSSNTQQYIWLNHHRLTSLTMARPVYLFRHFETGLHAPPARSAIIKRRTRAANGRARASGERGRARSLDPHSLSSSLLQSSVVLSSLSVTDDVIL